MKTLKRIIVVIAVFLVLGSITVFAENAATKAHITKMMSLIDKQNFENTLGVDYVKEKVNYLMYDSQFAATKNAYFGYPNSKGYPGYNGDGYSSVNDNGTKVSLRGSTWGCMTYARYANTIVNGRDPASYQFLEQKPGEITGEGLKEFLLTYGQAGEHLRIDSKHSVAFIAGDNDGFYYFNYNNDDYPFVTMEYESYEDFAKRYKNVPVNTKDGIKNIYTIWLYESNANVNKKEPEYFIPDGDFHGTPEFVCPHEKYSPVGFCTVCGKEFPYKFQNIAQIKFKVTKAVEARLRPYAVAGSGGKFKVNDTVTVLGVTNNHHGKPWYLVTCERLGSGSYWIYSSNVAEINDVKVTLNKVSYTNETSVKVSAVCSYTLQRPARAILLLGTSKKNMKIVATDEISFSKNPFDIWYNLNDVEKDKVYYYRIAVEFDRLDYPTPNNVTMIASDYDTFVISSPKTPTQPEIPETTEKPEKPDTTVGDQVMDSLLDAIVPLKFEVKAATNVTTTSARFNASCTYIGNRPKYVCLYLGLSKDENSMWQVGYDTINFSKNPFDVWYDISGMAKNTIYYYQFRGEVDGKVYKSEIRNITTMDRTVGDNVMDALLGALGNTKTGVVVNADSLAINDKPAASPKYSTMLVAAPRGATLTIYPDKQSGNWYYVTYNGVSGYAYGKYINLK